MTPTATDAQTTKEIQMTTTTTSTLEERLAPIAAELATVQDHIKALQERESHLKTQIRELVPGPDTYGAGALAVQLQPNRRFDADAFMAKYPATTHPRFYKLALNTTEVKKGITGDEYDALMVTVGEPKVSIR